MSEIILPILRFVGVFLLQIFVLNSIEPGWGIHLMVYPLFIAILPFNYNIFTILSLAFLIGFFIDIFSNTFGLHASSAVMMAMFRPILYKYFSPRDGYDNLKQPTILDMGFRWHLLTFGTLLIIHHFWFFSLESFRLDELLFNLRKVILSGLLTFVLCIIVQYVFFKKEKTR